MSTRPLLTVVVNFYRLGALADPCLRTLARNSDPRIRYVLVDDGSPDDTAERLSAAQPTLPGADLLLLPRNGGLAAARMAALAELDTEWVTFLDGDDWVSAGYFPRLLDETLAAGVPWVRTDHVAVTGRERVLVRIPDINRQGRIGRPRDSILRSKTSSVDFAHAWSGVYHRELVDGGLVFYPPELATAEDRPSIWALHLGAEAFTIARTVGVHYRQSVATSLTKTGDERQLAFLPSMRMVGEIVAADREADRFAAKVVRTWTGLTAWHWEHRARLSPAVRRRMILGADDLLAEAPADLLADAIAQMPESRRQMIEALRRQATMLRVRPGGTR